MKKLHETFISLAAQLQQVHEAVKVFFKVLLIWITSDIPHNLTYFLSHL